LYDVELQYEWVSAGRAELFYRLMLKSSFPRFYLDVGPAMDANTGAWRYINGEPLVIPASTN
jgi:hypothetical protein